MGVRRFPSLIYPHKPGMAAWLNDWAREFAAAHDEVLSTATLFPEPGVTDYVEAAIGDGAQLFKVHVQVGDFDPSDPVLDAAWGMLADAGVLVVIHAGSGPAPGRFTGPEPISAVLARHPTLQLIIAHFGLPEHRAFVALAHEYPSVRLDTTMAFTDFGETAALGQRLRPELIALEDRILFGTDFPNIPHTYAHQIEALVRLDLGDDWLRSVCWSNAAALFGVS